MPSNVFTTMAARAKAHHDALNSAYATYYAPGASSTTTTPTSSTETSRSSSITSPTSRQPAQKKSPTTASKAWSALKKNHRDMNEAYTVFYSPGASTTTSRNNSVSSSPRQSADDAPRHEVAPVVAPRNGAKVWKALKNRVVEHHKSVNLAYAQTYGIH